MKDLNVLVSTS